MIYKSYLVEENLRILKKELTLFYGENLGLKEDFKIKIKNNYKEHTILTFNQEDILKNKNILISELQNLSLFENKKVILIQNASDKLVEVIKEILSLINDTKVFIFSDILEKKSKLRIFFEKDINTNIVPCYQDNELTLKKITLNELKGYKGATEPVIKLIINNSSQNRMKLKNEIEKIKACFVNKLINIKELNKLLNLREDEDFSFIKDAALSGNNLETNKLLNTIIIEEEKSVYYLSSLLNRINRLKEVIEKGDNIEKNVEKLSPPIFWKDKPIFIKQAKIWNSLKLSKILKKTYNVEISLKSNSNIKREIILRKLIVEICNLANAA